MELGEEFAEGRALVGKEDSIVFLLGVINLSAVFFYSVYNQLTRPHRFLGGPNSYLSNEYIERKVQSILDELVLHVQTSTYYQNVINRDNSKKRLLDSNVPSFTDPEFSFQDGSNFIRKNGLPYPMSAPGKNTHTELTTSINDGGVLKRLKIVRRRKKSHRTDKALKLKRPFPMIRAPSNATQRTPNPVLLKHYYQPVATADRIDNSVEELTFVDSVKKGDKAIVHAPARLPAAQVKQQIMKVQKTSTRKPAPTAPETQTRSDDIVIPATQSSTVGLIRRLNDVVNITAPLATSIFDIFGQEFYKENCLEKKLCEVNQSWRKSGVVAGTLSPLLSIVMSWTMKGRGWPPLADTLTAIRSGWVGQPCQLLYSYCDSNGIEDASKEEPEQPPSPPSYSAPQPPKWITPAKELSPMRIGGNPYPISDSLPSKSQNHLAYHSRPYSAPPSGKPKEPVMPTKAPVVELTSRGDLDQSDDSEEEEESEEESQENNARSGTYYSGEALQPPEKLQAPPTFREEISYQQKPRNPPPLPQNLVTTNKQRNPSRDEHDVNQQLTNLPLPVPQIQDQRKRENNSNYIEVSKNQVRTTPAPLSSTTVKETTTTTATTTTGVPPGRPRSNTGGQSSQSGSPAFYFHDSGDKQGDEKASDFSTAAGLALQDQYVENSPLKEISQDESLAYWRPESNSFFDISEGRPGLYYNRDRFERRARNSKILRLPSVNKR